MSSIDKIDRNNTTAVDSQYGGCHMFFEKYGKQSLKMMKKNAEDFLEKKLQEFIHSIPSLFSACHLKREFYPNNPDGSNEEIINLINHSPVDISNRIAEGKGVFYMNPCISQTLHTVEYLKKEKIKNKFPDFDINLGMEFLEYETGLKSAHAFIQVKLKISGMPFEKTIIIDYSHNNDIRIYEGEYENDTIGIKKSESKLMYIPADIFDGNDDIFDIAGKAGLNVEYITGFKKNLCDLQDHLCEENAGGGNFSSGLEKFKIREKENGDSPIYCIPNGKDEKGDTKRLKLKIENGDKKKFLIENGVNKIRFFGKIINSPIWSELYIEDNLKNFYIEDDMGNKTYIQDKLSENVLDFILYCK